MPLTLKTIKRKITSLKKQYIDKQADDADLQSKVELAYSRLVLKELELIFRQNKGSDLISALGKFLKEHWDLVKGTAVKKTTSNAANPIPRGHN